MLAALLTLTLACGGEAPPRPAAPVDDQASLADVLAGMQEGPPEPKPPSEGAPPPEPTGLTEAPPPAEAEVAGVGEARPTGSADCEAARADRERLEARVKQQREGAVSRAELATVDAQASMNNCISDMDCAMDGKRIKDLQDRVAGSQRAYETALEQVGALEAGFYELDKRIRAACGG